MCFLTNKSNVFLLIAFGVFLSIVIGIVSSFSLMLPFLVIGVIIGLLGIYMLFKKNEFLLAATVYLFTLDTSGMLMKIPLKHFIFLVLFLKFIDLCINRKARIQNPIMFLTLCILVPIYGSTISIFRGTEIGNVIGDANGYFFFIIGYFMSVIVQQKEHLKGVVIKHFLVSSFIISIATLVMFWLNFTGILTLIDINDFLKNYQLGFAVLENNNTRIFLASHVYIMISLLYVFSKSINKTEKTSLLNLFLLVLFIVSIFVANARGLWVGTALGMGIIFLMQKFNFKKVLMIFIFLIGVTGAATFVSQEYWSNTFERMLTITDFSRDNLSNYIRNQQKAELLAEFQNYPILGKGFGTTLDSGYYRNAQMPYTFELSYLELLYKLGVFGFSLFLMTMFLFTLKILRTKDKRMKNFLIGSFVGFLFVSITNPYIVSSLGMFLLGFLYVLSHGENVNKQKIFINKPHTKKGKKFKKYKIVW